MKIACVLGPMFEDSEFKDPYDALRGAGHEVTIVGMEAGAVLQGSKGQGERHRRQGVRRRQPAGLRSLADPRRVQSRQAPRP